MSPLLLLGAAAAAVYLVTRSSSSQSYVKVEGGMQLFDDSKLIEGSAANNFAEAMPHYRPQSAPAFVTEGAYTGSMIQTMVYGPIPSSADMAKHKKTMTDALATLRSASGSDELFLCIKVADFETLLAGGHPDTLVVYYAAKAAALTICAPGAEYAAVPLAPV